jgi:aminocarboxymuconate-semialdehyde decarboxylase
MDCACCVSSKRRQFLGAITALAGGVMSGVSAAAAPAATPITAGVTRSIDIHAHYYPESYCDLVGGDGKKFGGRFTCDASSFSFQTPAGALGPLPMKFVDVGERLKDMDGSGVDIQALSLSVPMAYWGDRTFNAKLASTWNNAASEVYQQHPTRFVVLATLPMLNASDAIDELARAAELPSVRGV